MLSSGRERARSRVEELLIGSYDGAEENAFGVTDGGELFAARRSGGNETNFVAFFDFGDKICFEGVEDAHGRSRGHGSHAP